MTVVPLLDAKITFQGSDSVPEFVLTGLNFQHHPVFGMVCAK